MVTMKKKKQACQSAPGSVDLISDLFEDVLNLILVRLPIRDVVRTSILSKKWRDKWISISDLVFDNDCLMEGASEMEHAHVVNQVLKHHVGPICKFSCMFGVPSCSDIDRWVVFLSRNGIKKLTLTTKAYANDVPSSIFYCQELTHLELFYGTLKVPSTFKGFHNLLLLNLCVKISEDAIAFLISKCPLLERLKLKIEDFYQCLNIHAPNLRYFEFSGQF
ncbi:F-box/FBD/LRR-repeat-like protein isoform X1 [Cinnamomum micranthum f. kanehirae]|uniref:F-box/FBD/LRR-repeat-like protein isoform X1 n=1 Tax=Cinnamomum micranthum f. kanehirae TaxID=337451 RepID=A0A443NRI3_9MAGN|nr:F-box/FBD/LRR-repeat-like protein isoform X1 [Cinnamomum micranthum f. kanehirae]